MQAARFSPSRSNALARSANARHRIPLAEGPRSQHAVVNRPKQMATHPQELLDDSVHRREPLSVARYTCPRPPSPIVPVTEYGPSVVPEERGIDVTHCPARSALGRCAGSLSVQSPSRTPQGLLHLTYRYNDHRMRVGEFTEQLLPQSRRDPGMQRAIGFMNRRVVPSLLCVCEGLVPSIRFT